MNEHYSAVLADLVARREPIQEQINDLEEKLEEIDVLIEGIKAMAPPDQPAAPQPLQPLYGKDVYIHMSMRWAILFMLSEHTSKTLLTAEISSRLIAGGFAQSGNFNSKVSAILSQMFTKTEVEKAEAGWSISPHGEAVWKNIKDGDKFKNRHSIAEAD